MVKVFAWNVKDAGLSPAQHYSFPCIRLLPREIIIYFKENMVGVGDNRVFTSSRLDRYLPALVPCCQCHCLNPMTGFRSGYMVWVCPG